MEAARKRAEEEEKLRLERKRAKKEAKRAAKKQIILEVKTSEPSASAHSVTTEDVNPDVDAESTQTMPSSETEKVTVIQYEAEIDPELAALMGFSSFG